MRQNNLINSKSLVRRQRERRQNLERGPRKQWIKTKVFIVKQKCSDLSEVKKYTERQFKRINNLILYYCVQRNIKILGVFMGTINDDFVTKQYRVRIEYKSI